MYVEFDLSGFRQSDLDELKQSLETWARGHGVRYSQKTIKMTHRFGLDQEENFSLFAMTWDGPEFRLINVRGY